MYFNIIYIKLTTFRFAEKYITVYSFEFAQWLFRVFSK